MHARSVHRSGGFVSDTDARTPLHAEHRALGGRMVSFAGWDMPIQYAGLTREHQAVRNAVGLFDVSHMGRLAFRGADATALVDRLITNDLQRIALGQAVYTCACNEQGGILDDLIVYRLQPAEVLVVCNASNHDKIVAHAAREVQSAQATGLDCQLDDISLRTGLIAVQGPKALELVRAIGSEIDVARELPAFRVRAVRIAGIDCLVARTGYTGEDGVEIVCPAERAVELWRALLDKGRPLGVEPVGLGARDTLRLEARLALYGNEIDETTQPFEAGLGWVVKLGKADFIGKAALVRANAEPARRKLVGFEMVGRGIARHGYPLLGSDGAPLGVCTSGSPSPTLGLNIGLGYVPPALAELGASLAVDCRGRAIEARVVKTPFYKRPAGAA
jgi:glycine cleavage system T protein (aminomethyltransferase)